MLPETPTGMCLARRAGLGFSVWSSRPVERILIDYYFFFFNLKKKEIIKQTSCTKDHTLSKWWIFYAPNSSCTSAQCWQKKINKIQNMAEKLLLRRFMTVRRRNLFLGLVDPNNAPEKSRDKNIPSTLTRMISSMSRRGAFSELKSSGETQLDWLEKGKSVQDDTPETHRPTMFNINELLEQNETHPRRWGVSVLPSGEHVIG